MENDWSIFDRLYVCILQQGSHLPTSILTFDMKFITPLTIALLVAAPAIVLAADPPKNHHSLHELDRYLWNKDASPALVAAYETLKNDGKYEIMKIKQVMDLMITPEDKVFFLEKVVGLTKEADHRLIYMLISALKKRPVMEFCHSKVRLYFASSSYAYNTQHLNLIDELLGKMIDSLKSNTLDSLGSQIELDIALLEYYKLFVSLVQKKHFPDEKVNYMMTRCPVFAIQTLGVFLADVFNIGPEGIPLVEQCARCIHARHNNEPNNEQYKSESDFAQGYFKIFEMAKGKNIFSMKSNSLIKLRRGGALGAIVISFSALLTRRYMIVSVTV